MADDDDLAYLQPGFDLNSLKVAGLRGILLKHGIDVPFSGKKAQLIEVIEHQLLPKAKKLLAQRDRVRRTSKGITDVVSQESTFDDEDDRALMPPPSAKTPRSRKSKSNLAEASTPSTARRSKTPNTRKSVSRPRQSDTESEATPAPSAKKTRKSLPGPVPVPPIVRLEEPARFKREDASSPFSDENPFQSGSSPPPTSRRVSSTSRPRKSGGRPSSSRRRETTSPQIKQEEDGNFHSRHYVPVAALYTDADGVTTTEEFAPDARRELQRERAAGAVVPKGSQALVRRTKKPKSALAKISPVVVLFTTLAGIGAWYRQEKIRVGYCEVGQGQWSLAGNENIPAWVHEALEPSCEQCPPHAICHADMDVRCENDFILKPHPLAIYGLIPLPPTCEPDSEKARLTKQVADRGVEFLRDVNAAFECGDELPITDGEASDITAVVKAGVTRREISEDTLKRVLAKQRRTNMDEDEFEDLWLPALGDIKSRDEVEVTQDGQHSSRILLASTSSANVGFTCAVRRGTIRTLATYRIHVGLLSIFLAGFYVLRRSMIASREATAQVPSLVEKALDRLATQAALAEDGRVKESFIPVRGLRDDVLRHVFDKGQREGVWDRVKKIVEGNSNVRVSDRESERTGEVGRVWEWTGPVDMAMGLTGRQSGGFIQDGKLIYEDEANIENVGREGGEMTMSTRKWDEGRPIY